MVMVLERINIIYFNPNKQFSFHLLIFNKVYRLIAKLKSMGSREFLKLSLLERINALYKNGSFIIAIRYYGYKVNLYLMKNYYVEVFYNHKADRIEKVDLLDYGHSRLKFYTDQIVLPDDVSLS